MPHPAGLPVRQYECCHYDTRRASWNTLQFLPKFAHADKEYVKSPTVGDVLRRKLIELLTGQELAGAMEVTPHSPLDLLSTGSDCLTWGGNTTIWQGNLPMLS